jgi:glycosyl hydrolase family 2
MSGSLLDNLDVFYGELTPARGTVYARLEGLQNSEGLTLSGSVRGPRCYYSKTLPATFRLQDAGPGPSLLAKSLVPDPSFWSPDTPHIYDVTVELRKGIDVIASDVRQIGFKPLGISGRFFTWEGKPWVLRAANSRTVNADNLVDWSDRCTCILFVHPPTDEQLEHSASRGILTWTLMPLLERPDKIERAMCSLAQYPSVAGFLILTKRAADSIPPRLLEIAPNVLMGIAFGNPTAVPPLQRHRIFRHVLIQQDDVPNRELMKYDHPLIVARELGPNRSDNNQPFWSIERARSAVDRLQANLAPIGQFAGYIV